MSSGRPFKASGIGRLEPSSTQRFPIDFNTDKRLSPTEVISSFDSFIENPGNAAANAPSVVSLSVDSDGRGVQVMLQGSGVEEDVDYEFVARVTTDGGQSLATLCTIEVRSLVKP